jgi:hypothetical protein
MAEENKTGWKKLYESSKARMERFQDENKESIRYATDTIEVWGVAGALGYLHGRQGGMPKLLGIPYDLGIALAAKVVAFAGWAGKSWSADMHAIGNGAGAYYIGSVGADMGQKARKDAGEMLNRPFTEAEAKDKNVVVRNVVAGPQQQQPRYMPNNVMRQQVANQNAYAPMPYAVGMY